MSLYPCLSCVSFIWEQVCGVFIQNTVADEPYEITTDNLSSLPDVPYEIIADNFSRLPDLPYEIIADILSRLPAEQVFLYGHVCRALLSLTKAPSFIDMQLNRAAPVIAFHYYSLSTGYGKTVKNNVRKANIYITDEVINKIATRSVNFDMAFVRCKMTSDAFIYGSYNGFLLFRNLDYDTVLFIWNPVTNEQATVVLPSATYRLCGFFFHAASKEYRVLCGSFDKESFQYLMLSLKTKCTRKIGRYSYPPRNLRNPIFVNEVLYWMVDDKAYKNVYGTNPHCSKSILLFDTNGEEFSTMPHPGYECSMMNFLKDKHIAMNLDKKDGLLWVYDHSSYAEIVVWVRAGFDYKHWVKRHVFVDHLKMFDDVYMEHDIDMKVKILHIYGDEVLLSVICEDLFLYNMRLRTFRRVHKRVHKKLRYQHLKVAGVCHVNALSTLHTDKFVYLSAEPE